MALNKVPIFFLVLYFDEYISYFIVVDLASYFFELTNYYKKKPKQWRLSQRNAQTSLKNRKYYRVLNCIYLAKDVGFKFFQLFF